MSRYSYSVTDIKKQGRLLIEHREIDLIEHREIDRISLCSINNRPCFLM
jgi:hypothetical protein